MSQGPLCLNLSQKVQKEVSQMANRNLSPVILLGGLSVNLNHLKSMLNCSRAGLFSRFMAGVLPYMVIPKGTSQGNGTRLPLRKLESLGMYC